MKPIPNRIFLASRSPRRRELLAQMGVHFDLLMFRGPERGEIAVDESPILGESPDAYVKRVSEDKARYACSIHQMRRLPDYPLLSADTTVSIDGQIIGKPMGVSHAKVILERLSGKSHQVLTAVTIVHGDRLETVVSTSQVRFRTLSSQDIERYVQTGEPLDKAGAYGIQGRAGVFVEEIVGSYTGIMGLPLCETQALLRRFSIDA